MARLEPVIRNILRMSVYQLKYMDSVTDSAACNEAVKLAQRKGFYNLKGFVNGVMRSTARRLSQVRYPDPAKEPLLTWRSHANNLYTNWLNYYVYQSTPYDLGGTPWGEAIPDNYEERR